MASMLKKKLSNIHLKGRHGSDSSSTSSSTVTPSISLSSVTEFGVDNQGSELTIQSTSSVVVNPHQVNNNPTITSDHELVIDLTLDDTTDESGSDDDVGPAALSKAKVKRRSTVNCVNAKTPNSSSVPVQPENCHRKLLPTSAATNSHEHQSTQNKPDVTAPRATEGFSVSIPLATESISIPRTTIPRATEESSKPQAIGRATGKISLTRTTKGSSIPRATEEISLTCTNEADTIPGATEVDSIPLATEVDSIPRASDVDSIPRASEVDSIPRTTEGVSIPRASEIMSEVTKSLQSIICNSVSDIQSSSVSNSAIKQQSPTKDLPPKHKFVRRYKSKRRSGFRLPHLEAADEIEEEDMVICPFCPKRLLFRLLGAHVQFHGSDCEHRCKECNFSTSFK